MSLIQNSLPPGMQQYSTHQFGTLTITIINHQQFPNITSYQPIFMGENTSQHIQIYKPIKYKLLTNLWHFYVYLADMQSIHLELADDSNNKYFSKIPLKIKSSEIVLNANFLANKDLKILEENHETDSQAFQYSFKLYNSSGREIQALMKIKIQIQFDLQLHDSIKNLVQFSQLLVIDGISPITSQNQLPRQPPAKSIIFEGTFQPYNPKYHPKSPDRPNDNNRQQATQPFNHQNQLKIKKVSKYDEELQILKHSYEKIMAKTPSPERTLKNQEQDINKIMQEDIDRLIAEMQSKPYDSSRYQGNQSRDQQISKNIMNSTAINFGTEQSLYPQSLQSQNFRTQNNFNISKSTTLKKPPLPLQSRSRLNSLQKNQSRERSRQNSLRNMQNTQTTMNNGLNRSHSHSRIGKVSNGQIIIKIHQLLITSLDSNAYHSLNEHLDEYYSVRVYINDEQEEYFSAQGIPDGENLLFNQTLKFRNIQNIQSIRFALIDEYGYKYFEGTFRIHRLFESNNQKGMFMVPMTAIIQQGYQNHAKSNKIIKIKQKKIAIVNQDQIVHRTLRIQGQLNEKIELVQIFIRVSQFDRKFNICRYKIPLSKQTIEFSRQNNQPHHNIFPHNTLAAAKKGQDSLIIEFWEANQLVGQSSISLKAIKNYNTHAINANLQAICLQDCRKQIIDPFNDGKIVGRYKLELYFGNNQQTNKLLSKINMGKLSTQKMEVRKEERLGVLIKDKKSVTEVQIQTQNQYQQPDKNQQKQQVQDEKSSIMSENQFLDDNQNVKYQIAQEHKQQQKNIRTQLKKSEIKYEKPLSFPKISEVICKNIANIIRPFLPHLESIKQKSRSHLLYNFIEAPKLVQIMQAEGISNTQITSLFEKILLSSTTVNSSMINFSIFLDYCLHVQIDGNIRENMIADSLFIEAALRILYSDQNKSENLLLINNMQFNQFCQLFRMIKIKPTLHQYELLNGFISSKFRTKDQCLRFKNRIVDKINQQIKSQMERGMYEEDILQQIYGSQSNGSFVWQKNSDVFAQQNSINQFTQQVYPNKKCNQSFNQTVPQQYTKPQQIYTKKQQNLILNSQTKKLSSEQQFHSKKNNNLLKIYGIQNVKESAECLLDKSMKCSYIRVRIQSPIFQEIRIKQDPENSQFSQINIPQNEKLEQIEGIVELCEQRQIISCARFCLIGGIKSVYPMKTKDSQFCGLLNLLLN